MKKLLVCIVMLGLSNQSYVCANDAIVQRPLFSRVQEALRAHKQDHYQELCRVIKSYYTTETVLEVTAGIGGCLILRGFSGWAYHLGFYMGPSTNPVIKRSYRYTLSGCACFTIALIGLKRAEYKKLQRKYNDLLKQEITDEPDLAKQA